MNKEELNNILKNMSRYEKIGQLVCLGGQFFNKDVDIKTGPTINLGIDPKIIPYAGFSSNLPYEDLIKIQNDKMKNNKVPIATCCDVIHGYKTIFPIPLALSASFNMDLIKKCAKCWAKEASDDGIFVSFSPMLDLSRDPRWGRVMESFGEDPYLGMEYAKAYISGMQGNLKDEGTIGACVKHFAGYSLPEGGRDYQMSNISRRVFNDFYLPPYIEGIRTKPLMVMSGFNAVDLLPTVANKELLINYLRNKLKFDGLVISDYNAIHELVNHRVAKDDKEAALIAFKSGVSVDLMSCCYSNYLDELIEEGLISEEELDERVMEVLNLKNKLSLFENPYRFVKKEREYTKDFLIDAYKAATESIVLLKNDAVLPLSKKDSVLYVGPFISEEEMYGGWSYNRDKNITTIENCLKESNYSKYETFITKDIYKNALSKADLDVLRDKAKSFNKIVFLVGEKEEDSGEASSKTDINLNKNIVKMIKEIFIVNKNIVSVIFSGRPIVITDINDITKGLVYAFFPGTMGSKALLDLLYGKRNFSAKLTMSIPYSIGQIPVYYQEYPTGRPYDNRIEENKYYSHYLDSPNKPLYTFGDGLSYSKFVYTNLTISKEVVNIFEKLKISVSVKNESDIDGDEIVLLYVEDLVASVARPIKELKRCKKIHLRKSEEKRVEFIISSNDLKFSGINYKRICEKGEFKVFIGDLEKVFRIE